MNFEAELVGNLKSGTLQIKKDSDEWLTDNDWLALEKQMDEECMGAMEGFEEIIYRLHNHKEGVEHGAVEKLARSFLTCFKATSKSKTKKDVINYLKRVILRLKKFYVELDETLKYDKAWEHLPQLTRESIWDCFNFANREVIAPWAYNGDNIKLKFKF